MAGNVVANLGAPTSTTVGPVTGNGFQYSPNGTGGVNFTFNGAPITQQQYGAGTGQNDAAVQNILNTVATDYANSQKSASPNTPGNGGGSSAPSTANPSLAASYAAQAQTAQDQLNSFQPTLDNTLSGLSSNYNSKLNAQNQADTNAQEQYDLNETNNTTNEGLTLDQIARSTRGNMNAIQRLLGLAGSGNSSASEVAAPYLVNDQGAVANNQAQTSYGQGQQALDLSYTTAKQQQQQALTDLANAYYGQQQAAKADVNSKEQAAITQSLIPDLGWIGYYGGGDQSAKIGAARAQLAQLTAAAPSLANPYPNAVLPTAPTTWTAPALTSFASGVLQAPGQAPAPAAAANAAANVTTAPPPQQQQQNPLLAPVGG